MTRPEAALAKRFRTARDVSRGMMPQLGRVIEVDNAQRRVDVQLDGDRVLRNVPVLTPYGGTHRGSMFIGPVDNPDAGDVTGSGIYTTFAASGKNDLYAVIAYINGDMTRPMCTGFLFPEQTETSFKDVDVNKHHNGFVTVFTDDAFEMRRPDGTFIRIGAGVVKAALAAANYDAKSVPFDDTTGSATGAPDIIVSHSSGTTIRIDPSGNILITQVGHAQFNLGTHVHADAQGGFTGGPQ